MRLYGAPVVKSFSSLKVDATPNSKLWEDKYPGNEVEVDKAIASALISREALLETSPRKRYQKMYVYLTYKKKSLCVKQQTA